MGEEEEEENEKRGIRMGRWEPPCLESWIRHCWCTRFYQPIVGAWWKEKEPGEGGEEKTTIGLGESRKRMLSFFVALLVCSLRLAAAGPPLTLRTRQSAARRRVRGTLPSPYEWHRNDA